MSHPRDQATPLSCDRFHVDGVFHLDFEPANERAASWSCGVYAEIGIVCDGRSVEQHLEFLARSAADDVVSDMREAGYEPCGDTAELPIVWTISSDVTARIGGA